MKGFNFIEYLEKITRMDFVDKESLKTELGDNYEDVLLGKMSEEQAKQEYLDAQARRYSDLFNEGIQLNSDDQFIVDVFNEDSIFFGVDGIISLLNGVLTARKSQGKDKESQQMAEVLKDIVKEGYNIYPLMRCLDKTMKDYFKENPEVDGLGEIRDTYDGFVLLQSVEQEVSPYSNLFSLCEYYGKLKLKHNEMTSGDMEFSVKEIDDLEYNEDQILADIQMEISKFDLKMLESVIKNKRNLSKEMNPKTNENPLYQGLLKAEGLVLSRIKSLEQEGR